MKRVRAPLLFLLAGGLVWWAAAGFDDRPAGETDEAEDAVPETPQAEAPPPPDYACRIRGVVQAGGKPVVGARVLLIPPADVPEGLFLGRLTGRLLETDPAGRFAVDINKGERCVLRVVADGRGGLWRDVEWQGRGASRDLVLILPETESRTLAIDPPDAEVHVLAKRRRNLPLLATRAKKGRVTLALANDDVVLVRAPGRATYAGPARDTIRLGEPFRVAGIVVDEAGRVVRAALFSRRLADGVFETVLSDLDGRFAFEDVPAERTDLFVRRAGFATATLHAWPGDESVRVRLRRVNPTRGRVVDPDDKPVAGASILIDGTVRATTGTDGTFRIDDTPGGASVTARKNGLEATETAGRGPVELALRPPESIAVRFLDTKGRPVSGMRVRGHATASGADGRATLPIAAAGKPAFAPRALSVRVAAGTVTVPAPVVQPLPLPAGATVRLDPGDGWWADGKLFLHPAPAGPRFLYVSVPGKGSFFAYPWHGEKVVLEPFASMRGRAAPGTTIGWGRVATTRAGADGSFVLSGLRAARRTLWVGTDGDVSAGKRPVRSVALKAGGNIDLGRVRAPEARRRKGTVRDADGRPIGGARVRPLADIELPFTLTRPDGSYLLRTPHAGPLLVERDGFAPTPTGGGDAVLRRGGILTLHVKFPVGPVPRWSALLARGKTPFLRRRETGRELVWDGLPAGSFDLGVRIGRKTVWTTVAIRDGETATLTVDPAKSTSASRDGS